MIALWHKLPDQFEAQLQAVAGRVTAYHFDDGHDDVLRSADALEALGLRGVYFVITGRIDTPGWVSTAQIRDLMERGHEIGNHTRTHQILTRVGAIRCEQEIAWGQSDLAIVTGHIPRRFAWPHGEHNAIADRIAEQFGFLEVRDISDVIRRADRKTAEQVRAEVCA